jgi:hypothetical protein
VSAREVLKGKLKQAGLGRIADGVAELGRESFSLQTTKMPDENILIGASKLGGWPDLPPGFSWPFVKNEPLAFVAQVNLSELPAPSLLPRDGVLSFFYDRGQTAWGFDPKQRSCWRVNYIPSSTQLVRTPEPSPIQTGGLLNRIRGGTSNNSNLIPTYASCAVSMLPYLSIPDSSASALRELLVTEDGSKKT